ncbi:uncharacterized protein LOC113068630 [Carassius auratus]|uniref:Uncharacterized protein LOC113068630 n=1 Tax=Carassius auratus TaxID=7957 RepID=A0A6P6MKF4_CARAU|nr:uncharacterized protein LOC113068630 [Carassius auratus]
MTTHESVELHSSDVLSSQDNVSNWDDALIKGWDANEDAVVPNASESISSAVADRPSDVTNADNFVLDIDDQDLILAADSVAPTTVTNNTELTEVVENHQTDELNAVETPAEHSASTNDQALPSNQQCFIHELLLGGREHNRRVEEKLLSLRRCSACSFSHIDTLLTNSVEQGQICRLVHERKDFIAEQVKKIDSGRWEEFRERQLTVTLLSNIKNAVLGGGKS